MASKIDPALHIFATAQELGQAAAQYVSESSARAIDARGRFTVALSGGSLPKLLCPPLTAEPLRSQIDWPAWHVFWADERLVPLNHPDSNFRLAREYLFNLVNIPVAQVYPVDDSFDPPVTADAYEAVLGQLFEPPPGQPPRFDLILLGMGEDGHTASLFPHHPLLNETGRWVAAILDSPKPPPARITLTLPVLNNARRVAFITAGSSKSTLLARVLAGDAPPGELPAQMVQPDRGDLVWFVDNAATAGLTQNP